MSTADALTTAEFDPAQLGVEVGQLWVEPTAEAQQGQILVWEVLSTRVGRVTLREAYIVVTPARLGMQDRSIEVHHGVRMKAICPFVLAFTYTKGYVP